MEVALLCARLSLFAVFAVAGISKIADLEGSRRAMIGFGAPQRVAGLLGGVLPLAELMIAISLIPLTSAWAGAVAAGGLLLIFIAAIVANLARGRTPDCHCFGQVHSKPVGWSTVIRNILLTLIAASIVAGGKGSAGLSALSWLNDLKAGEMVGLALGAISVALLSFTFVCVRRILDQHFMLIGKVDAMKKVIDEDYAEPPVERHEAAAPPEGLPIGAPAPAFSLSAIDGGEFKLEDLLERDKSLLLLFVSPNCSPCRALLPAVREWERNYGRHLTIALLSKGRPEDNQHLVSESGARYLLLAGDSGILDEYGAKWTPAAVMVRGDGKIASPVAYGEEKIRSLVTRAFASADTNGKRKLQVKGNGHKPEVIIARPNSLRDLGKLAPEFSLMDANGESVSSEDLLGRDTLLLFWDPKCPYCKAMDDDIMRWEEEPPANAPRLVFVSSGDLEAVRADSDRFHSQFLHDPDSEVALLFGTNLTPSAVLIDASGRIASPPTAGKDQILALAGVRKPRAIVEPRTS
jgi:peroxiredoxin/uncharacterized membrane protein YphA (DoxX/SURF4 family)